MRWAWRDEQFRIWNFGHVKIVMGMGLTRRARILPSCPSESSSDSASASRRARDDLGFGKKAWTINEGSFCADLKNLRRTKLIKLKRSFIPGRSANTR